MDLTKNLTERLDLFKEGWPYQGVLARLYINENKFDKVKEFD